MSETINDDFLLNDDNDEDLDYDLDPNEEHALLQEDSDILDKDFEEEDVLELNEDYDQMDVNDGTDVSEKSAVRVNNDTKLNTNTTDKKNNPQTLNTPKGTGLKRIVRGLRRGFNKNKNSYPLRRSKTVLINPKFKGPVHVNSNQFAWGSPQSNTSYEPPRNPQFVQPWVNGNIQKPPLNTFAPAPFIPSNQGAFLPQQINTNYIPPPLQQPIQPFWQSQPMPNQQLLLNQPIMQLNPCPNQFHFQAPPQLPIIQQFPEPQKLPVHQRLGIPANAAQSNALIQTGNNQPHFNGHQNLQVPNNNIVPQQNFNQMPNNQQNHFQNTRPEVFQHSKTFQTNQYRKNGGNFMNNNNKVVSIRRNNVNAMCNKKNTIEKLEVKEEIKEEKKEIVEEIVPEDEDEETREYRKKIEEQKRKREEILRKKEESRRKNLAQETPPQVVTKPKTRSFQPKKFNFPHQQQNKQHKLLNYTNNIVITGNDNHHQFGQRNNTLVPINNNFAQTDRIIIPNNDQRPNEEVQSGDIASFLSTRSVITQDNLSQTNIVVVKNLALATNETKLMSLCRDIGTVQKLQMEKNEHQATIHFNTVASAHAFYNKFRRRMIDLSMVQVDLVPFKHSP